jgi:hypothetical protein
MEMFLWFVHLMRLSSALCDLRLLRLHAVSLSTRFNNLRQAGPLQVTKKCYGWDIDDVADECHE